MIEKINTSDQIGEGGVPKAPTPFYKDGGCLSVWLILLCIPIVIGFLNYTGMCFTDGQILDDSELIRRGIETNGQIITFSDSQRRNVEFDTGTKIDGFINYASADAFLKKNPDCCWIKENGSNGDYNSGTRNVPVHWKIMGWAWKTVALNVDAYYRDESKALKYHRFQWGLWVNTCGKSISIPLKYVIG